MKAMALTDSGNMFGAVEFYKQANEAGIKPIMGCELFLVPHDMTEKNPSGSAKENTHITLLCKNREGYRNLMKLVTKAYREGFYYHPRVDLETLQTYADGLIGLSGCWKSRFINLLKIGEPERAHNFAQTLQNTFGKDDFYVELTRHNREGEDRVLQRAMEIADDLGASPVATNDVHYLEEDEALAQQVMVCIRSNRKLEDVTRRALPTDEFYFKSKEEMNHLFSGEPEALENSIEIAERCNVELPLDEYHLPEYVDEEEIDKADITIDVDPDSDTDVSSQKRKKMEANILRERCEEALSDKYAHVMNGHETDTSSNDKAEAKNNDLTEQEVRDRLNHELKHIEQMGFPGYFLIVQDLIEEAKRRDIPVGPGRGSAAGCMVSYLLGITQVDPIEHNLIFERFLNPGRKEMPDIDIDFCKQRRDELIEFCREKYGEERVFQIITFGSMKARAVVRDVGRVLDVPLDEVDEIAKLIPFGSTLSEAEEITKLQNLIKKGGETYRRLWKLSKQLEGNYRHAGKHAAGVVISDRPLWDYCPVFVMDEGETTQFDGDTIEDVGLLKMDFLGLRNLTVIDHAEKLVQKHRGEEVELQDKPMTDEKTFELLQEGRNAGVFQLESSGMINLCKRLVPEDFGDVVALLALYRPGPLDSGMVEDYVERKHGRQEITYPHEKLEDILEPTYGVILYQEQVMQAANILAGFDLSEADRLRKAMGKKIPELLDKFRDKFVDGAEERGVDRQQASEIFDDIEKFGRYGFNRSHSAAYAKITMQTAYLKANYPICYMTALMTSETNNTDKLQRYINEARSMGIDVEPPNVNKCSAEFRVGDSDQIHYGLAALKRVGNQAAEEIERARKEGGEPFHSIFDLCARVDLQMVDRGCLESLVEAGAMDCFGENRSSLFDSLDLAQEYGTRKQEQQSRNQKSLFGGGDQEATPQPELIDSGAWKFEEKVYREKNSFGFYFDQTPLDKYRHIFRALNTTSVKSLKDRMPDGSFQTGGIVEETREIQLKSGKNQGRSMLAYSLKGVEGSSIDGIMFPDVMDRFGHRVFEESVILVQGEMRDNQDEPTINTQHVELAERAPRKQIEVVEIDLPNVSRNHLEELKQILNRFEGNVPVFLNVPTTNASVAKIELDRDYRIWSDALFFETVKDRIPDAKLSIIPKNNPS